jgi:predicted nucleic acid-binding protein
MRVFLDANILFSDAKSCGAIRSLLTICIEKGHQLIADGYVLEEAERNLKAKFPEALSALHSRKKNLEIKAVQSRFDLSEEVGLPPKDIPVLSAAIKLKCYILVTGDKTHFGHLYGRTIQGTWILSPSALYQTIA